MEESQSLIGQSVSHYRILEKLGGRTTKFNNRSREYFRRATRKDAQVIDKGPFPKRDNYSSTTFLRF